MSNPNELRLAHLRLDLSALLRMQDEYSRLSPETQRVDLTNSWTNDGPCTGEQIPMLITGVEKQIAELEASDE